MDPEDVMQPRLKVRLETWDDPAFHAAFEVAREQVEQEGIPLDTPEAGFRAEHLLAEAGYPGVQIQVIRSVDEAMRHVAHWEVHRLP
jgi:hypothetical protein